MSTVSEPAIDVRKLSLDFGGEVIGPGAPGYEAARSVFFPTIDRRPAVIVRPVDDAAVASAVALARDTGAELAVRSGGHSLAGHGVSEGGIVVDLAWLDALEIETEGRLDLTGFLGIDASTAPGHETIRYRVRVRGDATRETFAAIHETVRRTSPNVFNLSRPILLEGELDIG